MEPMFPFDNPRKVQVRMMWDVSNAISDKKHIIAHAPTGLGKTAATISPALAYAAKHGKNVIFVTPKHTQHKIVVDTLAKIKQKFNININVVDFIGKKWMCLVPGVQNLTSRDFSEFCHTTRTEERCPFYNRVKRKEKLTKEALVVIRDLKQKSPMHVEDLSAEVSKHEMCPYYVSCELAKEANFLIADYYHVFHPGVRKSFFLKTGKELRDSIIIVDEAQNLPDRIRNVLSSKLSNFSLNRAIREARKFNYNDIANDLVSIQEALSDLTKSMEKDEANISRQEFVQVVEARTGRKFDELTGDLLLVADKIRVENKKSSVGSIGDFLEAWPVPDEGYTRILKRSIWQDKLVLELSLKCLDPGVSSKELFDECHSAILMSGTLTPTQMYRDLLALSPERTRCLEYDNPFPTANRLALVVPDTTTKFTRRRGQEYEKIAKWCADLTNSIPGNVAVFFPSYRVRDEVYQYLQKMSTKTTFLEQQKMTKREKMEFMQTFKDYSDLGAVFLGVTGGNFGEGIDLPGKFLRGVVVVGIPFDTLDLEAHALIDYYDKKFGAGWNYGYLYPAMNRVVQACGRVVRSEEDRGVVVMLDERFTWKNYFRCLPLDWKMVITKTPKERIQNFFSTSQQTYQSPLHRQSP
jgi:DNA excision repair protein ERCC-2